MSHCEQAARRGRPDDVRQALLQAAADLNAADHAPTLREIVHHATVGYASGLNAIKKMRRAGLLVICGERRVAYRNKPVATYVPACPISMGGQQFDFSGLTRVW